MQMMTGFCIIMQIVGVGFCVVMAIDYSLVYFQMNSGYTLLHSDSGAKVDRRPGNQFVDWFQFGTGNVMFVGFSNKM